MEPELTSAGDLRPGDVVELPSGLAKVLGEPFLGRRGASVFDTFALFWRARVQHIGDDGRWYATWGVDDQVAVRRDPET